MNRDQLLADLQSFGSESDSAATELADRGDRAALPAILRAILTDCGFEIIPAQKIAAFIRLADAAIVPILVERLESLDEAGLEHDAGDVGDEFWRIQTAVRRILVGIGPSVVLPVREALAGTENAFAKECLGDALSELEDAGPKA